MAGENIPHKSISLDIQKRVSEDHPDAFPVKGKINVLQFWASWCLHCHRVIPIMDALYKDMPELVVVGINIGGRGWDQEANFIRDQNFGYTVGLDRSGHGRRLLERFFPDRVSIPFLVIVDPNGLCAFQGNPNSHPRFLNIIRELSKADILCDSGEASSEEIEEMISREGKKRFLRDDLLNDPPYEFLLMLQEDFGVEKSRFLEKVDFAMDMAVDCAKGPMHILLKYTHKVGEYATGSVCRAELLKKDFTQLQRRLKVAYENLDGVKVDNLTARKGDTLHMRFLTLFYHLYVVEDLIKSVAQGKKIEAELLRDAAICLDRSCDDFTKWWLLLNTGKRYTVDSMTAEIRTISSRASQGSFRPQDPSKYSTIAGPSRSKNGLLDE